MGIHQFSAQVLNELGAMKEVGMHVPDEAIKAAMNPSVMSEHTNMGISECAEMLIELANTQEHEHDPMGSHIDPKDLEPTAELPEAVKWLLDRVVEDLDMADELECSLSTEDYVRLMNEVVRVCTARKALAMREELG